MIKLNNIVFFASSPGGHFAQLLAMHDLFDKYQTVIVTNNQLANSSIPELKNVLSIERLTNNRTKTVEVKKKMDRIQKLPVYLKMLCECFKIWQKYRPKVIISTGSNIAIFLCLVGKLFGSKFVFIETRAKVYSKSATGKAVGRMADIVLVQWPEMVEVYEGKAKYLGTLV